MPTDDKPGHPDRAYWEDDHSQGIIGCRLHPLYCLYQVDEVSLPGEDRQNSVYFRHQVENQPAGSPSSKSNNLKKGWSRDITVAGLDEVIRQLPLQAAHSVKKMDHIKNLVLADAQFDQPGKIELLLGQNVWRHIFLDGRVKGKEEHHPEAWLTVFGWTILETYNPHSKTPSQPAITHVVASVEDNRVSNKLLSRFF